MTKAFKVVQPGADFPTIFEAHDSASPVVVEMVVNDLVYVDAASDENASAPDGWTHLEFRPNPTASGDAGWLQNEFIGDPHEFDVNPVDEDIFVRTCARAEITANAGGEELPHAILADYLIAWSWIETELTKFGNRLPGTSSIGPYQITHEEWDSFLADNPDGGYAPFQRFQALAQIAGAVDIAQKDWERLEELGDEAGLAEPEQTYIPSFLLLFQARLIGAEAAFGMDQLHRTGNPHVPIREVLEEFYPDAAERAALIGRRKRYLKQSTAGDDTTVDEFVEKTSAVLTEAFKTAFSKLRTHFPEFAIPPALGTAVTPWMELAEQEMTFWARTDVSETTALGRQRVSDYFDTTSYQPNGVEPWCGAFVSWCLEQAGAPKIKDGARAANWKRWGSVELRKGGLTDPAVKDAIRGAVVVLHPPSGNTARSGHVCFAVNRVESSTKVKCLGGNQSDTVRINSYDLSRIASIRALAEIPEPGGDDRLVLARTIYGEARSESQEGREAVAQVITNRARPEAEQYSNNVSEVCLQAWQFSCWNANDPNRAKIIGLQSGSSDIFDTCLAIADAALAGSFTHLTNEVLHYYADYIAKPKWVRKSPGAVMERKIGRHLFYRGIA